MKSEGKESMEKTWDEFASSSSVHGIRFTSMGFNRARRLAWGILIISGLLILIGMTVEVVLKYFRYEVNTVVTMVSEKQADFPALTICNLNTMRKSKFDEMDNDPKYVKVLTLAKILTMMDMTGSSGNITIPQFSGKDIKNIYRLFGHTMDSFDKGGMLLNCTYGGTKCDKSFFRPVLTQLGLCHTFNSGKHVNEDHRNENILKAIQPGSAFGLQIRLTVQANDYLLLPTQGFSCGWKMFIHDQQELPLADIYGFSLSPGTHTLVSLKKKKVINLEPPYKTACRKSPLENGEPYSRNGCLRLCQEKYVEKICGCQMPINFLQGKNSALCDFAKSIKCVLPALVTFKKDGNYCHCPEPCESIEYSPLLSYAYFPSDIYAAEAAKHFVSSNISKSTHDAITYMRKNIIELDVFYEQLNYMVMKQIPAKTIYDIYSELGGLLGASLGASFLTFIELCDFLFTRISRRYEKRRERLIKVKAISDKENEVKDTT